MKDDGLDILIDQLCVTHRADYEHRLLAVAFDPIQLEDLKNEAADAMPGCARCVVSSMRAMIKYTDDPAFFLRSPRNMCENCSMDFAARVAALGSIEHLHSDEGLFEIHKLHEDYDGAGCKACAATRANRMNLLHPNSQRDEAAVAMSVLSTLAELMAREERMKTRNTS